MKDERDAVITQSEECRSSKPETSVRSRLTAYLEIRSTKFEIRIKFEFQISNFKTEPCLGHFRGFEF